MIPPTKATAPQVRTSGQPVPVQARPLAPKAFKALLMGSAGPGGPAKKSPPPLPTLPKAPAGTSPRPAAPTASPAAEGSKTKAPGGAGTAVEDEKPRAKASASADKATDLLDPTARVTAHLAPPMASSSVAPAEQVASRSRVSLEELVPQVLRRIAWGGDRTKGSVHLELTSGDKVTVHAEGRRVRVEVDGNADLERRIGSRLRAAGIEVEGVR
jgi:hypothetical protein